LLAAAACLSMTAVAFSQGPLRPVNRRGPLGEIQPGLLSVLAEPDARADLKLSEDQERQIGEILSHRPAPIRAQGLDADERRKLIETTNKEWSKVVAQDKAAAKAILNDAQRARVDQIVIQIWGIQAMGLPEVAEQLGLTDEQRTTLREINRSGPTAPSPVNLSRMTDEQRQKSIADWVAARNEVEAKMLGVLSDEQKSTFAEIRGEPFAFPTTQPGGNISELLKGSR
jgi:hypothetical protein